MTLSPHQCVLALFLQKEGFVPEPYTFNETENVDLQKILLDRASNTSVGISCAGKVYF